MEQPNPPKLLDRVRQTIRLKHYSYRTEQTYVNWIVRYILFHDKRHPQEMGVEEVEAFLTHLAVVDNVAASTQNQALSALLFLYKFVLEQELPSVDALRAKKSHYLPTVLTKEEIQDIIQRLSDEYKLLILRLASTVRNPLKKISNGYDILLVGRE